MKPISHQYDKTTYLMKFTLKLNKIIIGEKIDQVEELSISKGLVYNNANFVDLENC